MDKRIIFLKSLIINLKLYKKYNNMEAEYNIFKKFNHKFKIV